MQRSPNIVSLRIGNVRPGSKSKNGFDKVKWFRIDNCYLMICCSRLGNVQFEPSTMSLKIAHLTYRLAASRQKQGFEQRAWANNQIHSFGRNSSEYRVIMLCTRCGRKMEANRLTWLCHVFLHSVRDNVQIAKNGFRKDSPRTRERRRKLCAFTAGEKNGALRYARCPQVHARVRVKERTLQTDPNRLWEKS
jgi:hypothetical protein